jgi:glycosyltransferase involved in cell wall biosynthesis
MRDELESLVKSLNIKNKVNLLGTIKHSEIADLYKKADVFVLASSNEGMSNSLLEALASELAIITTNVGGAKKLSKHNEIIIVDRNVISIYNALTSLSSNVEKLNLLKKESRFLAEKMDWSKIADQYIESYKIATKNQNS